MTVRQILELVENGTITNLDIEILDNDHIYKQINTQQSTINFKTL